MGYLGSRIVQRWQALGVSVQVTTRSAARAAELAAAGLQPVVADVLQPASLQQLPSAATVVYCVGFDRTAGYSQRAVYVEGLRNVLAVLAARPPQRFLYVSSTSVYGQCDGGWVDETAATAPAGASGQVLVEAEHELARMPRAIILRFAGLYGPGRLLRADALRAGQPLIGDPDRWLNLIHVEDGATAVLAAEAAASPGAVLNVADDEPVQRGVFFRYLAELLGIPPPRFVADGTDADPAHRRISNQRIKAILGWRPQYPSYRLGLPASVGIPGSPPSAE